MKEDYLKAVEGIKKRLVKRTPTLNLVFIGELKGNNREFVPKMVSQWEIKIKPIIVKNNMKGEMT